MLRCVVYMVKVGGLHAISTKSNNAISVQTARWRLFSFNLCSDFFQNFWIYIAEFWKKVKHFFSQGPNPLQLTALFRNLILNQTFQLKLNDLVTCFYPSAVSPRSVAVDKSMSPQHEEKVSFCLKSLSPRFSLSCVFWPALRLPISLSMWTNIKEAGGKHHSTKLHWGGAQKLCGGSERKINAAAFLLEMNLIRSLMSGPGLTLIMDSFISNMLV